MVTGYETASTQNMASSYLLTYSPTHLFTMSTIKRRPPGPTREDSVRKLREHAKRLEEGTPNPYATFSIPDSVLEGQVDALRNEVTRIRADSQKTRDARVLGGKKRGESVRKKRLDDEKRVREKAAELQGQGTLKRGLAKKIAKALDIYPERVRKILRKN
jgi:hypothetical protein